MASCYHCGEEIEFINNGFGPIPIHPSGSCNGRSGGYGSGGINYSTIRSTLYGDLFDFPFVLYPSYVNPNARCPVCNKEVYFYQSPYGGRVFFDELGPPWPKHPCTDNPIVQKCLSSAEGRKLVLTASKANVVSVREREKLSEDGHSAASQHAVAAWSQDGWMPFIVTKIIPKMIGVEAEGNLWISGGKESITFRISQVSEEAMLYQIRKNLTIGCSLVQNTTPILSALNECPVLLKQDPDLGKLILSSFILTQSGEVEEITINVLGTILG